MMIMTTVLVCRVSLIGIATIKYLQMLTPSISWLWVHSACILGNSAKTRHVKLTSVAKTEKIKGSLASCDFPIFFHDLMHN